MWFDSIDPDPWAKEEANSLISLEKYQIVNFSLNLKL